MQLYGTREFEPQDETVRDMREQAGRQTAGKKLRAVAAVMLALTAGAPTGWAQQATAPDKATSGLPSAPTPMQTEPLNLRGSERDFSKPNGSWLRNPLKVYEGTTINKASFANSVRLSNLVKDGKIYLSLSDAIALAIEKMIDVERTAFFTGVAWLAAAAK